MRITTLETGGYRPSALAMRLPMKSGEKSDSAYCMHRWRDMDETPLCKYCPMAKRSLGFKDGFEPAPIFECTQTKEYQPYFVIGPKDHELSMKLIRAGSDHRKHIRQIVVWAEIEAPLYLWKEFDAYRMGVEKVSESTMHTFKNGPVKFEDFELEGWDSIYVMQFLEYIERHRKTDGIDELSKFIPMSYKQKRDVMMSYEALHAMYHARKNHKLPEWHEFCRWCETLPYSEFITGEDR